MRRLIGALAASVLALACAAPQAQAQAAAQTGSAAPGIGAVLDPARGVLTFQPQIGPSLASVVRVVTLAAGSNGQRQVTGNGSGAVIDAARGLILTNNHVVADSQAWRIEFADGRTAEAVLVGADPDTDVAVLRVDTHAALRQIEIAESDQIQVGDLSFAVGYPMGLDQTVTMGIVSGVGRSDSDSVSDYIQTDAPINSGNSGGPLLDSRGRLIGMNTAILSRNGGNIGIGFAIPSRMAMAVASQLVRNGHVRRGHLGVSASRVTSEQADAAGLPAVRGARLDTVDAGGAAERAGLREGDIVVAVDGRPISGEGALRAAVGVAEAGSALRVDYVRDRRLAQARVLLLDAPVRVATAAGPAQAGGVDSQSKGGGAKPPGPRGAERGGLVLGASVRDVRPGDPYPPELRGVVVEEVADGSPAAQKGLRRGDLVVLAAGRPVGSAAELRAILGAASGQVRLIIARGNSLIPIVIGA